MGGGGAVTFGRVDPHNVRFLTGSESGNDTLFLQTPAPTGSWTGQRGKALLKAGLGVATAHFSMKTRRARAPPGASAPMNRFTSPKNRRIDDHLRPLRRMATTALLPP